MSVSWRISTWNRTRWLPRLSFKFFVVFCFFRCARVDPSAVLENKIRSKAFGLVCHWRSKTGNVYMSCVRTCCLKWIARIDSIRTQWSRWVGGQLIQKAFGIRKVWKRQRQLTREWKEDGLDCSHCAKGSFAFFQQRLCFVRCKFVGRGRNVQFE